tara:strand:- start:1241 stop:1729 length:489 start_codon:yes stop_codon:yes gene_type:complete
VVTSGAKQEKCLRLAKKPKHMVKEKAVPLKEVNWLEYYKGIQSVCPWSYRSYVMGGIITIPYNGNTFDTYATSFEVCESREGVKTDCFVYVCDNKSPLWLETKVQELQSVDKYKESEWLYSTPDDDEGNATPVPVIIQQRKAQLQQLREQVGYNETTESESN